MSNKEQSLIDYVRNIRVYLHSHPEPGFCENNTSRFIAGLLRELGMEVLENISVTGVIGILKGKNCTSSIAVRADMDCLNVLEETGLEYSSITSGLMHACGHDGHMAAVLGLAKCLSESEKLNNNVLFIFQPAEEGPGGAKPIIESGILDRYGIKAFLGMHIFPDIDEGRVGCCSGPMTARNGEIDITIKGKSGHGGLPHTAIDSVIAASGLLQSLQTIVSRRLDPRENAVITFGKISGGKARNIIASEVKLEGTIRAFSLEIYSQIKREIYKICKGTGSAYGCDIDADIRDMYPEVFNDQKLFECLVDTVGKKDIEIIKPLMIAEDFSYYRELAPELMFLLGSRNESSGYIYPLHSSKFNFNESILIKAIEIFKGMIHRLDE